MKQHRLRMGFASLTEAREYVNERNIAKDSYEYYKKHYINNYVEVLGENGGVTWMVVTDIVLNEETNTFEFIGTGFQYITGKSQQNGKETYGIVAGYMHVEYDPIYPDPSIITKEELIKFISNSGDITEGYKNFVINVVVSAYEEVNAVEYEFIESAHIDAQDDIIETEIVNETE